MAGNKINMPSGMGGLVRYFDEYRSKIEFRPGLVIVACILIILTVLLMHAWLGASYGF